jgi:catechol 2,3-dioxygenase-like lactoylglutathione lyase family enzyme
MTRPYVGRLGRPRRTALWSPERVHTRQGQPGRHGKRQAVITGVHHFSLSVADVDRSMAFYREFGFELVSDREVEGDYVEVMTGVPDAHVRITHLTGFGHNLELLEYRRPRGARRARGFHDVGSAHICLLTEDLDAECERLRALGVPFCSPGPVTTTSGPNRGGRGIYVEDPDGNGVEIIQLARPWARNRTHG